MLTVVHTITVSVLCLGGHFKHCEEEKTEHLDDSQILTGWEGRHLSDIFCCLLLYFREYNFKKRNQLVLNP